MDTANHPLTLSTMIETLLKDGYVLQYEESSGVFLCAKVGTQEIHFDGNFLEVIRTPFFGPKEIRNPKDPRIKNLPAEVTGLETGVTVKGRAIEKTCPHCGHVSRKYKVSFSSLHIKVARKIFEYCVRNKTHTFNRSDLAGIMNHTDYTNFSFLQRFGLLYFIKDEDGKKMRGQWGVPMKTLHKFLKNEWRVAEYFWRDIEKGKNELSENRVLISEIKYDPRILDPETMLPLFLEFESNPSSYEKE